MDQLRNIDLNLLVFFRVLFEERNVSKAAKKLGVTQSAVSHALNRLRQMFNDPLFTRANDGLIPSSRATTLAPNLFMTLEQIQNQLLTLEKFSATQIDRRFKISTTDVIEALLGPHLLDMIHTDSPMVKVSFLYSGWEFPSKALQLGESDLAIAGFYDQISSSIYKQQLFESGFSCAVKSNHPRIQGQINDKNYFNEKHILIAPGGNLGSKIDLELKKRKSVQRNFVMGMSNFLSSGCILEKSDAILTAPTFLINILKRKFKIQVFDPPIKTSPIKITQYWHERSHHDPAHQWFRENIYNFFKTI